MTTPEDEDFHSQLRNKVLHSEVKPKEKKKDTISPSTRILEKRREMQEAQSALDAQKEEFEKHKVLMQTKEEELKKKEKELNEAPIRFSRFLAVLEESFNNGPGQ